MKVEKEEISHFCHRTKGEGGPTAESVTVVEKGEEKEVIIFSEHGKKIDSTNGKNDFKNGTTAKM